MALIIANQRLLKQINQRKILNALREYNALSRIELSRLVKQDAKTVTNIVRGLLKNEMVRVLGYSPYTRGRPRELIELNADYGYIIGIDLRPIFLKAVIIDFKFNILAREEYPVTYGESRSSIIQKINRSITSLLNMASLPGDKVLGLGFAAPGLIDRKTGVWKQSVNIPAWNDVPILEILKKQWPWPIALEDSSRAAALGEKWFGLGKKNENYIILDLGAGIGCGIVSNNEVHYGVTESAGEIGHIIVKLAGDKCACGNRGCLETVASGIALARIAASKISAGRRSMILDLAEGNTDNIKMETVFHAAKLGDDLAVDLIRQAGTYIGMAIANLINILNPQMIIIGGHFSTLDDVILDPIKENTKKYSLPALYKCVKVVISELGDEAGVLGATTLILERIFNLRT